MKLVTFVTIISFLFVMVFLTVNSAGDDGGSRSHTSIPLKLRMAHH
ncbi:MAG: hypothetical protein JRE40_07210 [Deltaproteobacteria bacterium]|nr:hypothetical protein [Deltaproteobacteria bacterium]